MSAVFFRSKIIEKNEYIEINKNEIYQTNCKNRLLSSFEASGINWNDNIDNFFYQSDQSTDQASLQKCL